MCISLSFCLVSIRATWRVRRKSRRKRGRPDGTTGGGHDAEKSAVRDLQRPGERPHQASLHTIPERYRSQRRVREPPVIIGDPTDTNRLTQESRRRTSSRTSMTPQIEDTSPRSSRHSIRRSNHGTGDITNRNSFDLRMIPMIPQEDSEDILLTTSPHGSQSRSPSQSRPRSRTHTPTQPPLHTTSQS